MSGINMELSIICPINNLSYGITGTNIVNELIKMGHRVSLFPIGKPECHMRHADSIKQALANADKFNVHAPCIRLWHQFDMSMFVGKGKHIGFSIFELDSFNDKEKHHLKSCDEVWTCSDWGRSVLQTNIQPSIHNIKEEKSIQLRVIPLGVDSSVFFPKMSKRKPTVFLNVGKWEERKGHKELITAFKQAFTPDDNVELWMMCDNPFLDSQSKDFWEQLYAWNNQYKIRLIPRVETDDQVAEVMRQADCGVFPSHAEGWNLPALEMLACGKQVIATDYSAHTEFLTHANSLLIPITETESAYDGKWFFNQGNWARFDKDQFDSLISHMRYIHEQKQLGRIDINKAGIETAQKFSWWHTAECIIKSLS